MVLIKNIILIPALFVQILFAQNLQWERLNENPNYQVNLLPDSTVELNHNGIRELVSIKKFPASNRLTQPDLLIYLDTIDYTLYENYYRSWANIKISNHRGRYVPVDANKNGKNELYAGSSNLSNSTLPFDFRIYEHTHDSLFQFLFVHPVDTIHYIADIGDITGDGLLDLVARGNENKLYFFKQETSTSLISQPNFIYNPFPPQYQPNDVTFYDIDNDGIQEIIYYLDAGYDTTVWAVSNHIAKYDPQINNYELIYWYRNQSDYFTNGISIGDFDGDGKRNFSTGSIDGKLLIFEHVEGNQYKLEFSKQLDTYNAYLTVMTDDMDKNGEAELWIGGYIFDDQLGAVCKLYVFEASSPGNYEQKYLIEIRGLFSFIGGTMKYIDLDNDGEKDLFMTCDDFIFGFKYDETGNNYYMDFVKRMPTWGEPYTYYPLVKVDAADIDGDGVPEVIPQYYLYKGYPGTGEYRTLFLKRDNLTGIKEEIFTEPDDFQLYQNYPNPFNSETQIKFYLTQDSNIKIIIYNSIGKEIRTLVNDQKNTGEHTVRWNGVDNSGEKVSSGVYFINMQVIAEHDFSFAYKSIKSILLK